MENPPPGVDEAVAISNIIEMVESEEYSDFTRVVFDTAPTGHTLRLLTLPDFVEATLGKVRERPGSRVVEGPRGTPSASSPPGHRRGGPRPPWHTLRLLTPGASSRRPAAG